jgi:hypothetical protein
MLLTRLLSSRLNTEPITDLRFVNNYKRVDEP